MFHWLERLQSRIAFKGGSQSAPAPAPPSEEERALQRTQTEILRENQAMVKEQMRQQELLAPFIYKQSGLVPQYQDGKLVGFTQEENNDPNAKLRAEIEEGLLQRTRTALRGELPVDIGLMNELREADKTLGETLFKNLGPGYETSSPGIEAMSKQAANRSAILDAARRGDLTMAEGLSLAREGTNQALTDSRIARLAGIPDLQSGGIAALGRVAEGFGAVTQQMAQSRAQMNANVTQGFVPRVNPLLPIGASVAGAITGAGMSAVF